MDEQIEESDKGVIVKCCICIGYWIGIFAFVLVCIQIYRKQYNDGYFLDLYDNLNLSPIKKIEISDHNDSCSNLFSKETPIYNWKGKFFKFERINLKYINLMDKKNDYFEIGIDSSGNKLYSNEKVINFIEITESPEPSIDRLNYTVITQQIDSNTYLHYTHDYTEGRVLVDIKIGLDKAPCDDKTQNKYLNISNYICKVNDLDIGNTYQKLDNTNSVNKEQNIFLYSRTYIGMPYEYKRYHNLKKIKDIGNAKNIIKLLIDIPASIMMYCNFKLDNINVNSLRSLCYFIFLFFINILIQMICPLTKIILFSISIDNYNKYNNYIFSQLNHGIKAYYKKYIWFIKYDIFLLSVELFSFIPNIIKLCIFLMLLYRLFTLAGKKAIDTMSEKLKKREEIKQRIKKCQEEIKQLENNPDIPISKINKKRLEFFKMKFYIALTCPISLDLFVDPVIVSSGHTYERQYISKIINDKGNDPLTRQPLKNNIIRNVLVSKLILEFKSGKDFNDQIFNKMIELLKCPLSKKYFHEPYLASIGNEGMTYERSYIENYYYHLKKNDPTFDKPLKGEFIKNYVIKDMVDSLIEMNEKRKEYSIEISNNIKEKMIGDLITTDKLNDINVEVINKDDNKINDLIKE